MMRGGRSLVILLIVALGLGAYIYFVESDRDPAGTVAREGVFDVERGDITSLTVRASGAEEATTLERTGEAWTIASPISAAADSVTIDAILSAVTSMEIERVIEENPADMAPFGLDPAEVEVTFSTADGTPRTLSVGGTTPTGSGMYARTSDSPRLLLVPSYHKASLDKTTFDLRNRRVLDVAQATVERVELAREGAPTLDLRRADGAWRITAPAEARADASPVDSLVSRLASAQMSSIVHEGSEPSADDLQTWGLDTPQLTATVSTGSSSATLALGGEQDETSVYARDLSRDIVFTVDQALLTDLDRSADAFRVRDIFAFNAFSARRLEITYDRTTYVWEKSAPEGDTAAQPAWARVQPSAGEVNQTTMTDLLNALAAIRADGFEDATPSSGETIDVVVRFDAAGSDQEERATLRTSGETAHAVRADEPGAAVIPASDFETVLGHVKTITAAIAPGG